MEQHEMRSRVAAARVGRLATINIDGYPHLVPVCFAFVGDDIVTAVDSKPKTTRMLERIGNVVANSSIALLVDHYDDDWTTLWWIRVDGLGRVAEDDDMRARALELLGAKYPQYAENPPPGAMIAIELESWHAWP
jgi:PPOX class probable F420-dependent enzyme